MERLLVIGSTGLVGSKIASIARNFGYDAYCTEYRRISPFPNSWKLDVTDREETLRLVTSLAPDAIINTAALTNVDYCETHKEEADRVNVLGAQNVATAALNNHSRMVQISTDSVFDGFRGHYTELDNPHPLNHYSSTKLESERIVSKLPSHAIARPSVIYGWHSNLIGLKSPSTKQMNFAMFVLDNLHRKERVMAVTDQYSSPTFADNLAEALVRLAGSRENGIFHTAGGSCVSRYEFAKKLCHTFGYPETMVKPVKTSDFKQIAERPKNCCLNIDKSEKVLGMHFLTADEGIQIMKGQKGSKN